MLSAYAKSEWLTILAVGVMLTVALVLIGWWPLGLVSGATTIALLSFFRDPDRRPPTQRNVVVAPADGKVSSIHQVDHFEPFDGPATCVRIFLSVLDVHVNRCPCHGQVHSISHRAGAYRNALNPDSAEANESNLIVFRHPVRAHAVAAVRQVAGMLARTIVCGVREKQILQRGQRIGIIKLGSTTELYLPADLQPQVVVRENQKVKGGLTVLAHVSTPEPDSQPRESSSEAAADAAAPDASTIET